MKKLLFFTSLLISFNFFAQPNYDWSVQIDQVSANIFSSVKVLAVEHDASGNVFIAGEFEGTVDFDVSGAGGLITSDLGCGGSCTSEDPFVAKYDASGNFLWVQKINNPYVTGGNDRATSLAVDPSGSVYVSGSMYNGGLGSFIAKYNSSGTLQYLLPTAGYSTSNSENVLCYNGSYLYYINRFTGSGVDLDPGPGTISRTSNGAYDIYIARINPANGSATWVQTFGGTGYEEQYDIECDGSYIYVTGGFTNTVDFDPGGGVANRTAVGNTDIFLARYLASTGAYDYAYTFGSSSYERGYDIELEGASFLYFNTQFVGTIDFQYGAGTYNLTSRNGTSASSALIRMNRATGAVSWADTLPGSNGGPAKIVIDGTDILGVYQPMPGTWDYDFGAGTQNRTISNFSNKLAFKYSNTGGFIFAEQYHFGASSSYYQGLDIDGSGGFFTGADFNTSVGLDPSSPGSTTMSEAPYGDDGYLAHYTLCTSGTNTTSTAAICENQTKALTSTSTGGSWSIVSGGGSIIGTTYTPANVAVNTSVTIRYTDGCGNTSDVTFTVNVYNIASNTTSTAAICETATKTLVGSPSGGTWSIVSGGGSISGTTYTPANISVQTSVTIRYTIPVNGACPATTSDVTFLVDPVLSPSITSSGVDICNGSTRALTGTPSGGSWSVTSGPGSISGSTLTATGTGTITIQYTLPTNACGTYATAQNITSVGTLSPSITSSGADLCNGSTRALTGTPSGGSWTVVSGPGSISGSTLTATGVGTVQIRYTVSNACGSYNTTQNITTVGALSPSITSSGADLCNGSTRALTGTPSGGSWTVVSGPGSISGSTLTATGLGTVQIRYTVSNACGSYNTTQNITTVGALSPSITSSGADLCNGSTRVLTGTPSGGSWTVVSGPGSISGSILTATGLGTVQIRYTVSNACGSYNTTQNINTVGTVSPSITNSSADICSGATRALTATPSGGSWSVTSGPGSITGSTLTAIGTGTIQIQYSVTNACGTYTANQSITSVGALSPSITSISADICNGNSRALTATPSGGAWSVTSGPGSITGTTLTATGTGTIQIQYSVTNACGTYTANQSITSVGALSPSITSSSADICNGNSRALTATPSGGSWSVTSGPGSITGTTLTATGTGTIQIQYSVTNACGSYTDNQSITAVGPLAPAITSSNADLCNGSSRALTGTPSGGTWSVLSGPGSVSGSSLTCSGLGTITIQYSVTNVCGTYTTTQNITGVDVLSPSITSSNSDMCIGDNRSLTGTPSGGTWSITSGGAFGNISGGNQLNATATGTITVQYSVTNACGTYTTTQNINVVSTVTPAITSSIANMCVGDKRQLTASPGGGNWTVLSGPGSIGPSDTLTATGSGTIQIRYSVSSSCGTGSDTVNITVNPVPTATITSSNSTLCVGSTRALSGTPVGGVWSVVSGPGSITGSILTSLSSGTIVIEYAVTQSGCTGTTTQTINMVDSSNATWTSPGTICENAGLTDLNTYLAPFATLGGVWSGSPSLTSGGILNPSGLAGSTLTIKYKVGTAPCQDSLTLTINIQNNVDPTWTNPTAICENAGLTDLNTYLSGSATTGGVWSGHASVTAGGILNPTGLAGSSLTIKYKVGTSPCIDSMSHTFTINPASSGAWTNPVTVCENSPIIDLNTLITGNTGGTWAGTNVTVGGLFNPSGLSGSIAITYMVGTAPCADTVTQNVTVNPAADASWSIPTTICESQMFDLDTLLLPSATLGGIWSGPGVTGSIFDPFGLTAPVTIKYMAGTLGCADSLSITISTIAPSPGTPVVSLTVDTTCAGDTTTIMTTGSGSPVVYNIWTASSGGTFLGQAPLTVSPSVTTTYYVEAIAPNLCPNIGGRQSIEVVVNPLPTANAGVDENICYGDSVTLVASGGGTYVWSNSTVGANNTVNPITTTNYIVYVTSTTGCTDRDTVTVNVQTTGSANAQDDAYSLITGTQESIDVYSNDAGSVSTIMIIGGPFNGTATVSTGGVIDYISTLGYIGMDSLYYQICDPSCTLICDTAKLVIEVQNDLTIPTGMSPNNDGKNDFFNILGIEKYPDNELYVYNRWGDIVYQAVPYNNDWSGESINAILGDKVVEGTYFYILKLGTDLPTYKGYIEVKK